MNSSKAVRLINNSQSQFENNYEQNSNRLLKNMFKIQQSHESGNMLSQTQQNSSARMNESGANFNTVGDANEESAPMILNDTDMRYENVMQDRNNQKAKERFI